MGAHIREVVKRVVFLLRKLKSHIAKQYFVTAYYGLFHSHVNYYKKMSKQLRGKQWCNVQVYQPHLVRNG